MLNLPNSNILLCVEPTDMRKSFDSLAMLVRGHMGGDPLSGSWVFVSWKKELGKRLDGALSVDFFLVTNLSYLNFMLNSVGEASKINLIDALFVREVGPVVRVHYLTVVVELLYGVDLDLLKRRPAWNDFHL